ncbi:glycosyltransferase [Klebsiella pneumoniae]|uniref:glycosyltransferase n=1 Tax=Klebsiella pneumoniae TaxID=573 RepID=UPI003F7243D1
MAWQVVSYWALERKCIESWSIYNPDYKVIIWDEKNLVINDPEYNSAYEKKQWAYCADLARMKNTFTEYGGFHLDTDMVRLLHHI